MTKLRFSVISVLGMIVMLGLLGITPARASSLTADSTQETLTIVFDTAPEFNAVQAPMVRTSASRATSSPAGEGYASSKSAPAGPDAAAVPEPGTLVLMGLGVLGLLGVARRKRR